MKAVVTPSVLDVPTGTAYQPDCPPPIDFETEQSARPNPHYRIYAGTPAYSDILRHKLVYGYYSDGERTNLYRLHAPKREGAAQEESADEPGEGEDQRQYYFSPVEKGRGGMIRVLRTYVADRPGYPLDENVFYELEATERLSQGTKAVTEKQINSGEAWASWGALPITKRRDRDTYADLVKAQIGVYDLPILAAHTTTGFFRDGKSGSNYYLLPDGRTITATGGGDDRPFVGYAMPRAYALAFADGMRDLAPRVPAPDDLARLLAFYRHTAPNGHLLITVGAAVRSLVHTLVPAATVLVNEGPPESGKTSSQMHARGVIGPSPYGHTGVKSECDADFKGTPTSLETLIAAFSDAPVIVDNFRIKPTDTPHTIHEVGESLDRICVSAESGGEMRARANRDATKRRGHTIKTLPMINGEQLPDMLISTFRRIILLPYVKDQDILLGEMVAHEHEMQPILTQIGHAVIRTRLAAQDAGTERDLRDLITRQEDHFTTILMTATSTRTGADLTLYRSVPANWARILTGLWLVEHCVGASGFVDAAIPFVVAHMNAQLDRMTGASVGADGMGRAERLIRRFIEKIRDHELIGGQTWYIADLESGLAHRAPQIDDLPSGVWGFHGEGEDRTPVCAGYVSGERGEVYISPKAIDQLCKMAVHMEGIADLAHQNELWKAAQAEGWIARAGDTKHKGVKFRIGNLSDRGWAIRLDKWLDRDDPTSDPASADGAVSAHEGQHTGEPTAQGATPATSTPITPDALAHRPAATSATSAPIPVMEDDPMLSNTARRYIGLLGPPFNEIVHYRRCVAHYADIGSPPFVVEIGTGHHAQRLSLRGDELITRLTYLLDKGNQSVVNYANRAFDTLGVMTNEDHEGSNGHVA